jgi:hypothetical protein
MNPSPVWDPHYSINSGLVGPHSGSRHCAEEKNPPAPAGNIAGNCPIRITKHLSPRVTLRYNEVWGTRTCVTARSTKNEGSSVNTYYSELPTIRGILRLTDGCEQWNVSCVLPTTALFSSALSKLNQAYLKCSNDAGCSNRMKTAASSCTVRITLHLAHSITAFVS